MGGHVLIVDRDPARRADLRSGLALTVTRRPEVRLAALHAGAEDVLHRDTPLRILQARLRSFLRQRQDVLDIVPRDEDSFAWSGLAEAPASFAHALPLPAAPPPRAQVGLLVAGRSGASPPPEFIARLLEADVTRFTPGSEPDG